MSDKTPEIIQAALQFRADILAGDAAAGAEIVAAYTRAYEATRKRLDVLLAEIRRETTAGGQATTAQLFERDRLGKIIRQTSSELARVATQADALLTNRQRAMVQLAQEHAQELGEIALRPTPPDAGASWSKVPARDLENLAGFAGDGAPLSRILNELVPSGAERVRSVLLEGVAVGRSDVDIARDLRDGMGADMARALTIMRTETMRAYREAQRQAFVENADVIEEVQWIAALSSDTCPACLAMHGKKFPVGYVMESHPNCRCVLVPVTKTWAALGFDGVEETAPEVETGVAWFERQPDEKKQRILGPAKFSAYQKGEIALDDCCGLKHSDVWGGMRYERSLEEARKAARVRSKSRRPAKASKPAIKSTASKRVSAKPVAPSPVVPVPIAPPQPPPWRPAMTAQEANEWARDSVYKSEINHITESGNVDPLTNGGFDLARRNFGRVWGDGVYGATDSATRRLYEGWAGRGSTTLRLRVNVKNVLVHDVQKSGTNGYMTVIQKLKGGFVRFNEITEEIEQTGKLLNEALTEAFSQQAKESGYDALRIIDVPNLSTQVGGNQLVVFDPKNVVIIQ